jgi:CO/xanthine dehydrogenase FAD-binding subunit
MQSFEYAIPAPWQEAVALLSAKWGEADILAGGTDCCSHEENLQHAQARGKLKKHQGAGRHQ